MKLRFVTLVLLAVTVIAFGQDVKPTIPQQKPLSMDTVKSVIDTKNAQIDEQLFRIARNEERIAQLTEALLAKQAECTAAKPESAAKSGGR